MENKLDKIFDYTKRTLGLTNYHLKNYEIHRECTFLNETIYIVSMKWTPPNPKIFDESLIPIGTAIVDINFHNHNIHKVHFEVDVSYANQAVYPEQTKQSVLTWARKITSLPEGQEMIQIDSKEGTLSFHASINGVPFSPPAGIDVEFNNKNQLIPFSFYGHFPSEREIKRDELNITFDQIESVVKSQCKRVLYSEGNNLHALYGIEKTYFTNSQKSIIILEDYKKPPHLFVNKVLKWDKAIHEDYIYGNIDFDSNVTLEQAEQREVHPDTFPITDEESKQVIHEVTRYFQREHPADSGKWYIKSIRPENGYIFAHVKCAHYTERLPRSNIKIAIDRDRLQVVKSSNNDSILNIFKGLVYVREINVSNEEAYQKLKGFITLSPVYAYDPKQNSYQLCGRVDCNYILNAKTGEVFFDKVLGELFDENYDITDFI